MSNDAELSALVLKLAEIVGNQREELELIRADMQVLAHSAVSNVSSIKGRLDRAEEAITKDQPKILAARFDRIDAKIEEIFARLTQVNSRISRIDETIEKLGEKEDAEGKYREAMQTLSGMTSGKLDAGILERLEK